MSDVTDAQLAEWEKLAEAATPGPWEAGRPDMATLVDGVDSKWIYSGEARQYCAVASGRIKGPWEEVIANAEFIAAARTVLPALLREVRRLRGLALCPQCRCRNEHPQPCYCEYDE